MPDQNDQAQLREVTYRQADHNQRMMRDNPALQDEGTNKPGFFHGIVHGTTSVYSPEADTHYDVPYDYALVEDAETGQLFKVQPNFVRFVQ